jgi:hypothetical protein
MNYGSKAESIVSTEVGNGKILSQVTHVFVGSDLLPELQTRCKLAGSLLLYDRNRNRKACVSGRHSMVLLIATLSIRNSMHYGAWKCIILITKDHHYSLP